MQFRACILAAAPAFFLPSGKMSSRERARKTRPEESRRGRRRSCRVNFVATTVIGAIRHEYLLVLLMEIVLNRVAYGFGRDIRKISVARLLHTAPLWFSWQTTRWLSIDLWVITLWYLKCKWGLKHVKFAAKFIHPNWTLECLASDFSVSPSQNSANFLKSFRGPVRPPRCLNVSVRLSVLISLSLPNFCNEFLILMRHSSH